MPHATTTSTSTVPQRQGSPAIPMPLRRFSRYIHKCGPWRTPMTCSYAQSAPSLRAGMYRGGDQMRFSNGSGRPGAVRGSPTTTNADNHRQQSQVAALIVNKPAGQKPGSPLFRLLRSWRPRSTPGLLGRRPWTVAVQQRSTATSLTSAVRRCPQPSAAPAQETSATAMPIVRIQELAFGFSSIHRSIMRCRSSVGFKRPGSDSAARSIA